MFCQTIYVYLFILSFIQQAFSESLFTLCQVLGTPRCMILSLNSERKGHKTVSGVRKCFRSNTEDRRSIGPRRTLEGMKLVGQGQRLEGMRPVVRLQGRRRGWASQQKKHRELLYMFMYKNCCKCCMCVSSFGLLGFTCNKEKLEKNCERPYRIFY